MTLTRPQKFLFTILLYLGSLGLGFGGASLQLSAPLASTILISIGLIVGLGSTALLFKVCSEVYTTNERTPLLKDDQEKVKNNDNFKLTNENTLDSNADIVVGMNHPSPLSSSMQLKKEQVSSANITTPKNSL